MLHGCILAIFILQVFLFFSERECKVRDLKITLISVWKDCLYVHFNFEVITSQGKF